ncbi:MAG: hypothetical protein DA408_02070, partial [Bacteroidetes bacterium]
MDCAACHSPASWDIPADHWIVTEANQAKPKVSPMTGMLLPLDTSAFNHRRTNFPLTGHHAVVNCRDCHATLVFDQAKTDCISCHTDVHQMTVGNDCARCHTSNNWLVDDVTELHQANGFPLTGVHANANCVDCHMAETALRFDRNGNDCISCHAADFAASTNPNHTEAGFSTDCLECHDVFTPDWHTDQVNHDFFPLTLGHDLADCARCHTNGDFAHTPTDCFACHQTDFETAQQPNHLNAGMTTDCATCHTTNPDWMPAEFLTHDAQFFPIYSGAHEGEWSACVDCHTDPTNFAAFTCTTCHTNPTTDDGHTGVGGYVFESNACLACHPMGGVGDGFDHNLTGFPLTGAHLAAECLDCHAAGYAGTPTDCAACHTLDFNEATNPNHVALGIPTDCATCHTTEPGWAPATFAIHDDYYPLNGAHAPIANDCALCHVGGNYTTTPNTCAGCHTPDFNATTNPNHAAAQFSTTCTDCHTEEAWAPSTFDHNAFYPLNGAHGVIANECALCHIGGNYTTTPNTCAGCHTPDFNATTNPNHAA